MSSIFLIFKQCIPLLSGKQLMNTFSSLLILIINRYH